MKVNIVTGIKVSAVFTHLTVTPSTPHSSQVRNSYLDLQGFSSSKVEPAGSPRYPVYIYGSDPSLVLFIYEPHGPPFRSGSADAKVCRSKDGEIESRPYPFSSNAISFTPLFCES